MDDIERNNFLAHARGTKAHDDWNAYMVESLRGLGRTTGQVKHYEKRVTEYLALAERHRREHLEQATRPDGAHRVDGDTASRIDDTDEF